MISATADLRKALVASLDYEAAMDLMRAATTAAELEACAKFIDDPAFDELPPDARSSLAALYAQRLFLITGALA